MGLKGAFGHFITVTKHRLYVTRHCAKAGIFRQGLFHDMSKYSPTEFIPGVKFFIGTRSPNELERDEYGYSLAWMHHKGRNKHHFEYWTDYNTKTRRMEPVKMPLRYVIEMVCDRIAASKIYQGKNYKDSYPLEYFYRGKPNRIIHEETSLLTEKLLTLLAEHGEDVTFACMRELLKEGKY